MKQLTHIKNKTYIIKQRGRFSKEYLDKMQRFMQYYRKNPSKFMEDFYGLKLPFWQRLMIEILLKFNKFRREYV